MNNRVTSPLLNLKGTDSPRFDSIQTAQFTADIGKDAHKASN